MTTVTTKSDSDKKTLLLMQLAEELGLPAEVRPFRELTVEDMIHGIGRKATDEELIAYLDAGSDAQPIDLDEAFAK